MVREGLGDVVNWCLSFGPAPTYGMRKALKCGVFDPRGGEGCVVCVWCGGGVWWWGEGWCGGW